MQIKCKAGSNIFEVNGENITNDVAPFEKNDRTFLPIRFIAENMGMYVDYEEKSGIVTVSDVKTHFDTVDKCAVNFGMYANCASIAMYKELGAYVFEDENGYYWDGLEIGQKDRQELYIDSALARKCKAILHTHGGTAGGAANNHFSTGDKKAAKKYDKPIYLCSPVGEQLKYEPDVGKGGRTTCVGYAPIDWKHEDFCTDLGYRNYETAKNDFLGYFGGRYKPIAEHIPCGYVLDYYNFMFLNVEKY